MNKLVTVKADSGDHRSIAGAEWTWKIRSAQTNGSFCFFEMNVEPGQGIPLHVHGYPEAFYVLDGTVEFHADIGDGQITNCGPGDVVLARPEVPHSFFNRSRTPVRLLSISTAAHEPFFDAIVAADRDTPFAPMSPEQMFARVATIGAQTDCRFLMNKEEASSDPAASVIKE
jgi:mannose-6-phosphate isomerase-like protein (cupin superfamily)